MTEALQQEIRTLKNIFESERDPEGRVFAPLADAHRRAGELQQALRLLNAGLVRHPHFVPGHVVAAQLYAEQGLAEEAMIAARQALELDGDNVNALASLLRALEDKGDDEAGDVRARLLALEPGFSEDGPSRASAAPRPRAERDSAAEIRPEPITVDSEADTVELGALRLEDQSSPLVATDAVSLPEDLDLVPPLGLAPLPETDATGEEPIIDLDSLALVDDSEDFDEEPVMSALDSEMEVAVEEPIIDLDSLGQVGSDWDDDDFALPALVPEPAMELPTEEPVIDLDELAPIADDETDFVSLADLAPEPEEVVMDLGDLAPEPEEAVMDLGDLAPEPEEEAVMELGDLAPEPEEAVMDLGDLAPEPEEEAVMELGDLAPEPEEVVMDLGDLAPEPEEEAVMDLGDLAPEPEEAVMDLGDLAPEPEEEAVMDLGDLAPEPEEEAVMDLGDLAPEPEEAVMDLGDLAPEPEEEAVMELGDLAPEPEEVVMDLGDLAPEPEEDATDLPPVDEEVPVVDLGVVAPDGAVDEGEMTMLDLMARKPEGDDVVIDMDALKPAFAAAEVEVDDETLEVPEPEQELDAELPGEPVYTRTLGELYVRQGAVDQAIGVFRHLHEVNPGDAEIARRLEELESGGGIGVVEDVADADEEVETLARDLAEGGHHEDEVESPFAWAGENDGDGPDDEARPTIGDYFEGLFTWKPGGDE